MDNGVQIALIVAFAGVVGPSVLAVITNRAHRREKAEDNARQDRLEEAAHKREVEREERLRAVATQAEEAARLLLEDNATRAAVLASADQVVNGKLNQIHELVNSTLSAAMTSEHTALRAQLVALRRVVSMQSDKPSQEELDEITEVERRIAELGAKLRDRAVQTELADAQVKH
jgi:hypothetical protein